MKGLEIKFGIEMIHRLPAPRPAVTHHVKSWPEPYEAVDRGEKTHEVRTFDRDYRLGDSMMLEKWDPVTEQYLGPKRLVEITHITWPGTFSLPLNTGVLSIRRSEGDELL